MIKRTSTIGRITLALAGLVCLLVLGGCQSVASPVAGIWIQDVSFPLDAGTTRVGTKEGKACATSYVGVFARGDASIKAAAANGGITQIDTVEATVQNFIVIGHFCTVVRGS